MPPFTGAVGWGAESNNGARSAPGSLIHRRVTTLADSGPGSLRTALTANTSTNGLFITFTVGGYIDLTQPLRIEAPYVTILGQTAPGDGIVLRRSPAAADGDELMILDSVSPADATNHIIIRYLAFRHGKYPGWSAQGTNFLIKDGTYRVYLDHCEFTWGEDENCDMLSSSQTPASSPDTREITYSHCIFGETQNDGSRCHRLGGDSDVGGWIDIRRVSIYKCLYIHHNSRGPRFGCWDDDTDAGIELINNVSYNATEIGGSDAGARCDYLSNYVLEGSLPPTPWEDDGGFNGRPYLANRKDFEQGLAYGVGNERDPSIHMAGNEVHYVPGASPASATDYDMIRDETTVGQPIPVAWQRVSRMATQPSAPITPLSASQAFAEVVTLGDVGNRFRVNDAGDLVERTEPVRLRLLTDARNREAQIGPFDRNDPSYRSTYMTTQADVGGYPALDAGTPYTDTDGDGISDTWETANGRDPNTADSLDLAPSGFTYLEEFSNGMGTGNDTTPPAAPTGLQVTP